MHVAVFTTFAASKKEPLADMAERVHAAFLSAGFPEPTVRFAFADATATAQTDAVQALTGIKRISSVERVVKKWPRMQAFERIASSHIAGGAKMRALTNLREDHSVEPVDFHLVCEIARGVPKAFPFHAATLHFSAPGFSEGPDFPANPDRQTLSMLMRAGVDIGAGHPTSPGVNIKDSWWVNGRERYLAALRVAEADPAAKAMAPAPAAISTLFAACGKIRKNVQVPIAFAPAPQKDGEGAAARPPTEVEAAIQAIVRAYRARLPELIAAMPHDLPHQFESSAPAALTPTGAPTSGPKKPQLARAFAPLGYDCHGESGAFALRRRTAGALTVKLVIDVGTWSNAYHGFLQVLGLVDGRGFKATLPLPASPSAAHGPVRGVELFGQFPIGDAERWAKIVDNLAWLVATLERGFVPEIEAAAGPSPQWYRPEE